MPTSTPILRRAIGRCPDCGHAVEIEVRKPRPARVLPHGCPARACETPGCTIVRLHDDMVQLDDGAWYCPPHGLLVTAKTLVALYRADGDANWTHISELIGETLPELIETVEAGDSVVRRRSARHEQTP
jgi:hypothetical protein